MDNQHASTFELPVPEGPAGQVSTEAAPAITPERLVNVGNTPGASMPMPTGTPTVAPMQPVGQAPVAAPAPVGPPTSAYAPVSAQDADLIEKEWVLKAKHIVAQTRSDPFQQNRQINRFKAEYIKKRYNKDIKTAE